MTRNQRAAALGAPRRSYCSSERPSGDLGPGPRRSACSALRQPRGLHRACAVGWEMAGTLALLAVATLQGAAQSAPAPAPTGLTAEVLALACAPRPAFEIPPMPLRITGGQDSTIRRTYAPGDLLTINAGTDNGIEVGQQYYTRRLMRDYQQRVSRAAPGSIRTTGWVRVYAVDTQMSLATIEHACETIDVGDYLEPFELPVVPAPETTTAKPQRENYGRIMFGNDFRQTFGKGDLFVVNRGSDHGVTPGARFVVYRDKRVPEYFLFELGEAVAMQVGPEASTLQVTIARDALRAGDYVAIRK